MRYWKKNKGIRFGSAVGLSLNLTTNKQCTSQVDGINEPNIIAEHFALHFEKVCSNNTGEGAARLKSEYFSNRLGYKGQPHSEKYTFDAELVENVIVNMKRGKAPGLQWMAQSNWMTPSFQSRLTA